MRNIWIKKFLILGALGISSQANADCPSVEDVKKALQTYTGLDMLEGHLQEHFNDNELNVWLKFDNLKLVKDKRYGLASCNYNIPVMTRAGKGSGEMTILVLADK